jgi:hypothetical protein
MASERTVDLYQRNVRTDDRSGPDDGFFKWFCSLVQRALTELAPHALHPASLDRSWCTAPWMLHTSEPAESLTVVRVITLSPLEIADALGLLGQDACVFFPNVKHSLHLRHELPESALGRVQTQPIQLELHVLIEGLLMG